MKLYKVSSPEHVWEDGEVNKAAVEWQGTQADARKSRRVCLLS